jgi:hypothetical protein
MKKFTTKSRKKHKSACENDHFDRIMKISKFAEIIGAVDRFFRAK